MLNLPQHFISRFETPFRVGSTSYVYPDDILPNVEQLAAKGDVDDIELILFEVDDGPNNLPNAATVQKLSDIAAQYRLTYTVHLPVDLQLATEGDSQHRSLIKAERVIKTTRPLDPFAYVFLVDGKSVAGPGRAACAVPALETGLDWWG